jgi:hypothetical protein
MNTEQKTPIEWFQQLKEPYRSEAINNLSKKMSCYIEYPDSLIQALNCSFAFADSNEGNNYWWEILRSIKAGKTTYLETELKPQDMISGEWYVIESVYNWIIKFKEIIGSHVYVYNSKSLNSKVESIYGESNHCNKNNITLIRPATRKEVLEHFPDEFKDEKKEQKMKILVEAQGDVKYISADDFIKINKLFETISKKYSIDIEINNFKVDANSKAEEKKEVESEYIYFWTDGVYHYPTKDIDLAIENARPESLVYRATPIGTKQTKSILEPIKTKQ